MNGKLQVISAIIKLDRPFRPPNIVDMTGLDRQLIRYHLARFIEHDFLEKVDKHYILKDREGLLDEMTSSAEQMELSKMQAAGFVTKQGATILNTIADTILWARALDIPDSKEAKDAMLKQIDDTITEYKRVRKYVTNSQRSKGMAAKRMNKIDMAELYEEWTSRLRYIPSLDSREWVAAAREIIVDEIENEDA